MSGGRVVLGIGSGDLPWEFEQMGLTFPPPAERAAVLEEALQVVPALLRGEEVHFAGDHFHVKGATLRPPAAHQPYVPLLVPSARATPTLPPTPPYASAN